MRLQPCDSNIAVVGAVFVREKSNTRKDYPNNQQLSSSCTAYPRNYPLRPISYGGGDKVVKLFNIKTILNEIIPIKEWDRGRI